MRYLIAMIFAIALALVATKFAANPVAAWVVEQNSFESPDQVSNLHGLVWMAVNATGLIVGWIIGWGFGGAVLGRK